MSTFLFAPGVRVYIATESNGTIDVSEDLVDGSLMRRSDGISTFNFSLQNTRRKYDQVFTPNDRLIVEMKRIKWVRVFTGYLNSVPLLTAWPRVVSLSASCSLKRLQYWYWDPDLSNVATEIALAISAGKGSDDAGIANAARYILKNVVGWPESKVHIGEIPGNWFELIKPYVKALESELEDADVSTRAYLSQLAGSVGGLDTTTIPGSADSSVNVTSSGSLASNSSLHSLAVLGNDEAGIIRRLNNAEIIYRVGRRLGCTDYEILSALTTALHESAKNSHSTAVGLFQQMPKYSDFTRAELLTANGAAEDYFRRMLRYPVSEPTDAAKRKARAKWELGHLIAVTQVIKQSQFPDMTKYRPEAEKILKAAKSLDATADEGASTKRATQQNNATKTTTPSNLPTAREFVSKGLHLLETYPHIRYGSVDPAQVRRPTEPDQVGCSGLVSWILWNTIGYLPKGWPIQHTVNQVAWLRQHGGKAISVKEALKTQGALLYKYHPGVMPGHVEISLGDGSTTLNATNPRNYAKKSKSANISDFTVGYLLPMIDYTGAKNGESPLVYEDVSDTGLGTGAQVPYKPASDSPGYNSSSSIDRLFGDSLAVDSAFNNEASQLAATLVGPRALMNDQPLMPYIMNLLHSSMRSFCSSPNGDLMAWFPDYYGLWGTAAKMTIEPIELVDFYVEWSDDAFVTHQFTTAGQVNYFDAFSGNINTSFTPGAGAPDLRVTTIGIATIEIEAIMKSLFGQELTGPKGESFSEWVLRKFGARPDYQQVDGLIGKTAELFSAMYFFMRQWAYQYNANIPLTFMPELWPGMIVQIPEYDFQAYVTAVTHNFRFGRGGGFTTTVNVAAPARIPKSKSDRSHVLVGLPLASNSTFATDKSPAKSKPTQNIEVEWD
jgi:cell wall-associated NlpC family hydrolase